jgi:hypothetical protein
MVLYPTLGRMWTSGWAEHRAARRLSAPGEASRSSLPWAPQRSQDRQVRFSSAIVVETLSTAAPDLLVAKPRQKGVDHGGFAVVYLPRHNHHPPRAAARLGQPFMRVCQFQLTSS